MTKIYAPFTREQVDYLNAWQKAGYRHPYTCTCGTDLVATTRGWICKYCNYTQTWAHDFSAKVETA